VFITAPGGYFEVAEACSGVKFLIAMVAYGTLVANVCFRSWPRRAAFMAMALVVPILANGVRAWGTVFIAGKVGIGFAAGFDHVFYGWVFFAIVMALVMAAGWKFFDRAIDDPMIDADAIAASPLLGRLAACAGPKAGRWARWREPPRCSWAGGDGQPAGSAGPCADTAARRAGLAPGGHGACAPWQPLHTGAEHRLLGSYADAKGHRVEVSYALYAGQAEGKEAGGFGQGALPLGSSWAWEKPGLALEGAKSDVIQAPGPVHRLALTWYRTGDLLTGSNARLAGQHRRPAAVASPAHSHVDRVVRRRRWADGSRRSRVPGCYRSGSDLDGPHRQHAIGAEACAASRAFSTRRA
jgi:exosortase/archaeosortase family protein